MLQGPQRTDAGDIRRIGATPPSGVRSASKAFELPAAAGIPATPPPEVLQALDRTQRVAQELRARNLAVRFDVAHDRRVTVHVVDGKGAVVRKIPVVEAIDLLSGESAGAALLE